MRALTSISVILFILAVPVFHHSAAPDLAEEYFGVEACTDNNLSYIAAPSGDDAVLYAHGGGLNKCGCHFNRKTGECHCHQDKGCGCECQPSRCD